MRIAVIHEPVFELNNLDSQDTLIQVSEVKDALLKMGHNVRIFPVYPRLTSFLKHLESFEPDLVFNLVESIRDRGSLAYVVPAVLEKTGFPYTGASAGNLIETCDKILVKKLLIMGNVPTPEYMTSDDSRTLKKVLEIEGKTDWILKMSNEHSSIGIDESSICSNHEKTFEMMEEKTRDYGIPFFAERYVEGREFCVSLMGEKNSPQTFSPMEIVYDYPESMAKFQSYRSKWDPDSPEYRLRRLRFDFPESDISLLEELKKTAAEGWGCLGLEGYARIDFRVDSEGRPWIIDVNVNPCISHESSFRSTLENDGLAFELILAGIMNGLNSHSWEIIRKNSSSFTLNKKKTETSEVNVYG